MKLRLILETHLDDEGAAWFDTIAEDNTLRDGFSGIENNLVSAIARRLVHDNLDTTVRDVLVNGRPTDRPELTVLQLKGDTS